MTSGSLSLMRSSWFGTTTVAHWLDKCRGSPLVSAVVSAVTEQPPVAADTSPQPRCFITACSVGSSCSGTESPTNMTTGRPGDGEAPGRGDEPVGTAKRLEPADVLGGAAPPGVIQGAISPASRLETNAPPGPP